MWSTCISRADLVKSAKSGHSDPIIASLYGGHSMMGRWGTPYQYETILLAHVAAGNIDVCEPSCANLLSKLLGCGDAEAV